MSWREIWAGAAVLLALATLFAVWVVAGEPLGSECREDETWGYFWLLITPILAAASAAVMTGVADHAAHRAGWRVPFGFGWLLIVMTVAVLLSWVMGYVVGVALEGACIIANEPYGAATIVLPVAIGVATVVVPLGWMERRH